MKKLIFIIFAIVTMAASNDAYALRKFICLGPHGGIWTGLWDGQNITSWTYHGSTTLGDGFWHCWFTSKIAPSGGETDYTQLTSEQKYVISVLNSVRPGYIGQLLKPTIELEEHMRMEAPQIIDIPIDMIHGRGAAILLGN